VAQPPGVATPLHVHTQESEPSYALVGTLTYRAGDEVHHLSAGWFIHLPVGVPHAFRIAGTTPARILALAVPGRLIDMYGLRSISGYAARRARARSIRPGPCAGSRPAG
jgi:uncharacterized cupin superfamily protein